ncbi:MAG: YbaY family lipoprotein [Pirellulaceae bacterium]|jgi:uncharacterized lipoprotein YbaY|nr:YbaY family lipoprotein [Pirellulaceae bacterium]
MSHPTDHHATFATNRSTRWSPLLVVASLACFVASATSLSAQTRWDTSATDRDRMPSLGQSSLWQGNDWLGTQTQQQRRWRLGVSGQNRDTGVLVNNVSNNSAAARARIEVGDLIVNVGGFQVGMVAGRVYDLAEEINRRADPNGSVTLIIQDHRSGQLASVPIQLDNPNTLLVGTVNYRDGYALPADAIVTVQIENVTRPYYSVHNGTKQFRPGSGNSFPFEIAYDPTFINSQDTYQVRATITSGGRTIADTIQPQRVLTNGGGTQAQLTLASVNNSNPGGVISAGYGPNYDTVDSRLTSMYRRYLNRDPTFVELAVFRTTPDIENRLNLVPLDLLASQEYFDAAGNNNAEWLGRIFTQVVKRPPTQSELQQWMQRYGELRYSRTDLLRQLFSVAAP